MKDSLKSTMVAETTFPKLQTFNYSLN